MRICSSTSPEAPPASGRLKNAPHEARGLASRQPGLSRCSSERHLFRRQRSTSHRHTFSNTIWLFHSTHMGSAHRNSHRCVCSLQHNCLCATDGCARSEKDQQGFVRARPLHVAQPHRHPHRSRTRPGHCGPPLTTAGVRQRGCSPSDGVSAMTRGVLHGITNKCPHRRLTEWLKYLYPPTGQRSDDRELYGGTCTPLQVFGLTDLAPTRQVGEGITK